MKEIQNPFISLSLPGARWDANSLPAASLRELILDHYDREHLALRRYASYLGLDADAAQDVVQESFLRLHEHLSEGGERGNLRAWLYRVAHNLARNRQLKPDANHDPIGGLTGFAEPRSPDASAESALLAQEREATLRLAIELLPPAQRECVVLRAQGLKYREIAEVLGLSVSTIGEHIERALKVLREAV